MIGIIVSAIIGLLTGCTPSPEANVITHLVAKKLGTFSPEPDNRIPGSLTGSVHHGGIPVEGTAVVVAERYGTPHVAFTDQAGRYRIDGIPPGQYVPSAVAPGYDEAVPHDMLGLPRLVTIESELVSEGPPIELTAHVATPLPDPLAESVNLTATGEYTASAPFPSGSTAQVRSYAFEYDNVVNDSLRVYLPEDLADSEQLPMLLVVYPGPTDNWEAISVALSVGGFAVVAISPTGQRRLDIDGHAMDARIALNLGLEGDIGPGISDGEAVTMGGSFSSPVLRRLLRDEQDRIAAWIVLGGISDAFSVTNDFYMGRIQVPPMHDLAIPSLGLPNLYPLPFLRYSTIYAAGELPPTMIIHTASDTVTLIDQAFKLEAALREVGVPVEAYYYDAESHYLQIGENMTEAGEEMYYRVLEYVRSQLSPE